MDLCPGLTGHGLRFKTKADKQKAEEEERKENETTDGSATEMKKSGGGCGASPQPLVDPQAEQQQARLPV